MSCKAPPAVTRSRSMSTPNRCMTGESPGAPCDGQCVLEKSMDIGMMMSDGSWHLPELLPCLPLEDLFRNPLTSGRSYLSWT
jgi:hypothetical protein